MKRLLCALALLSVLLLSLAPLASASPGQPTFIVGINKTSLEYSCQGAHLTLADFQTMHNVWHANTVRLPLSSEEWANRNGICPTYQQTVVQAVQNATHAGLYVILALAWTSPFHQGCAPSNNPAGAGYPLPSVEDATAFWTSVGHTMIDTYNFYHVGFEVYSEPHDVTWAQWHDGGTLTIPASTDRCAGTYQAMGMQAMADLVTSIVGWHSVFVSGNEWGGDLSGPLNGYPVNTGKQRVYALHFYPGPNSTDPANWPARFGNLAAQQPVVATEFGDFPSGGCADNGSFNLQSMPYMSAHLRGMTAWVWNHDVCGLITSYATGAPSAYGAPIHDYYVTHF
jgi:hypothetical protein